METKGITCKIPLDLHNRISEEIRETESTISKFIEMVIMEHYEKGAVKVMEKGRTLAFQVSEELFQRVKEYLENYEKNYHRRLTQKEFVIGLIEQALEEAEEEFEAARAAEQEEQAESGWEAAEGPETDEEVPDYISMIDHNTRGYSLSSNLPAPFGGYSSNKFTELRINDLKAFRTAYCIQLGVGVHTGIGYDQSDDYAAFTAEQKSMINTALTLG